MQRSAPALAEEFFPERSTYKDGFGDLQYWNDRYAQFAGDFEWYENYHTYRAEIFKCLAGPASELGAEQRALPMLNVGCGNSAMSFDLLQAGFTDILNIDYSSIVIEQMRAKYIDTAMRFEMADACHIPELPSNGFQFIIDKGTLDAMHCAVDGCENIERMVHEMERLLRPGGVYLIITFGAPDTRLEFLDEIKTWTVTHSSVADLHFYSCRKNAH